MEGRKQKDFLISKHKTTIIPPYMQLQGEKDNGKNKENSTDVTLNIDTDFMFYFLILQKYSKIKFLTLLPSKFLTKMYIRLSLLYILDYSSKKNLV